MVKIENIICETTLDARIRERYFYEQLSANMNMRTPLSTSEENKEKAVKWRVKYKIDNKEAIIVQMKQYYNSNKAEIIEWNKKYRIDHKDAIAETKKKYRLDNNEIIAENATERIYCEDCNCYYSRRHRSTHNKGKKHQANINKIK